MRIWLNPMKMSILKITPTDVISAISAQNKQAAVRHHRFPAVAQ